MVCQVSCVHSLNRSKPEGTSHTHGICLDKLAPPYLGPASALNKRKQPILRHSRIF